MTEFPKKRQRIFYGYSGPRIDRWMQKCIDDFPKGMFDRPYFHGGVKVKLDSEKVISWFEKWFLQFMEEENES